MASKQITVSITSVVNQITIDVTGAQLYLEGSLVGPTTSGGTTAYEKFSQNVTSLLDAQDLAAAQRLAARAQAWIDSKLP